MMWPRYAGQSTLWSINEAKIGGCRGGANLGLPCRSRVREPEEPYFLDIRRVRVDNASGGPAAGQGAKVQRQYPVRVSGPIGGLYAVVLAVIRARSAKQWDVQHVCG